MLTFFDHVRTIPGRRATPGYTFVQVTSNNGGADEPVWRCGLLWSLYAVSFDNPFYKNHSF